MNPNFLWAALLVLQAVSLLLLLVLVLRNPADAFGKAARENREELSHTIHTFSASMDARMQALQNQIHVSSRDSRQEFTASRQELTAALQAIRADNSAQLDKMRATVDEKLQHTLETRLGQSFKLVSEQLEQVQKGLGEMSSLAAGVGDLQKVLSNVKTKGVLGEYQLKNILKQLLTNVQYAQNVKTKHASDAMVEFAVKIPARTNGISKDFVWLPIDAKFPTVDYQRLKDAYEQGDAKKAEVCAAELAKRVKQCAKDIAVKYIDPPETTDFAVLFLPFEDLYAEVLRIDGLFEYIHREYRVTVTGPTTMSAFLSSVQIGLRAIAVEKRTSEVWKLLTSVKKEFGEFGTVLEKTRQKIDQAGQELDKAGIRSREIERSLKKVETLPDSPRVNGAVLHNTNAAIGE